MTCGRAYGPGQLMKRNNRWVLRYTDYDGKRRSKVLAEKKGDAERIRAELIHQRDMAVAGLGSIEGQSLRVSDLVEPFLEDLQPRVTEAHFENVESRLKAVVKDLGKRRVRDLRTTDLVRIRSRATAEGLSNRTANLRIDRLVTMMGWAEQAGLIAKNPVSGFRRLREDGEHRRYKRRSLTDPEIDSFLAASEEDDDQCSLAMDFERVPQTPMWLAFLETGARWNELRTLCWGDVDFNRLVIVLRAENTKSRKTRAIPIRDDLAERLKQLRVLAENVHFRLPNVADRVFLSPEGRPWKKPTTNAMRIFDRVLRAAGIEKLNAMGEKLDLHALRHTFASRLARGDVGLVQAQRLLGHADPKTTAAIYMHLDVEDLRCAVESLGGSKPRTSRNHEKKGIQ